MKRLLFWLTLLLGLPLTSAHADERIRVDVPMYAASLVGTPYHYGGSTLDEGFDCSGLVAHVFRQILDLPLPHGSQQLAETGAPIERDALEPGDLVFFNTLDRAFSHVGIYLGAARFVHASSSSTGLIMVSNLDEPYWHAHYDGARRLDPSAP